VWELAAQADTAPGRPEGGRGRRKGRGEGRD
jgi:hypothetical protein